jgi:hypothetical protein
MLEYRCMVISSFDLHGGQVEKLADSRSRHTLKGCTRVRRTRACSEPLVPTYLSIQRLHIHSYCRKVMILPIRNYQGRQRSR